MKILIADFRSKQRLYCQDGHKCSLLRAVLTDGTSAVLLYRLQSLLVTARLVPLALVVQVINKWFNGCMIGLRASFGPGLVLVHPVGVVINSAVRTGANVWIQSGVVIGENRGKSPVLGNNVFIGSGAKVIGGISLGDDVRVGANSVVLNDVANGVTVVGIPARLLKANL